MPTGLSLFVLAASLWLVRGPSYAEAPVQKMAKQFCVSCHNADKKKGDMDLEAILPDDVEKNPRTWENVVRKLNARQMPPLGKDRPDDAGYNQAVAALTSELDRFAAAHPTPGRTDTLRRM